MAQDKEVPTLRAKTARKEVLTQDWAKKTAKMIGFYLESVLNMYKKQGAHIMHPVKQ